MTDEKKHTPVDQLVDIRDVRIDSSLPTEERIKSFVEQIKGHAKAWRMTSHTCSAR